MFVRFLSPAVPKINFENDPLVKELFGEPVRRRRTDPELAAWRLAHHKAAESTVAKQAESGDSSSATTGEGQPSAPSISSGVVSAWSDAKDWLVGSIYHPQQVLVKPTAPVPPAATAPAARSAADDGDEFVTEYKRLSYDKFSQLLKRKVLPDYLKQVQTGQQQRERGAGGGMGCSCDLSPPLTSLASILDRYCDFRQICRPSIATGTTRRCGSVSPRWRTGSAAV
jgi:hypothetical protein